MTQSDLLSQDEIDALLMGGDEEPEAVVARKDSNASMKPFNPATQHRVIKERLHALDIINERFARTFRMSLFNMLRRTADITVQSVKFQSFNDFQRNVPVPANLNLIAMKPLKGTALVVFPPALVYMVVENLFGGDGKFVMKTEGKEFTATENRIIVRLLTLALDAYKSSWKSVYPLEIDYLRSEMQARFANVTNSPNEIIVNTTFSLEVGNTNCSFNIALPYLMIEPIKSLLNGPLADSYPEDEQEWKRRMKSEIKSTHVDLTVDFLDLKMTMSGLLGLRQGDVIPIDLPKMVTAMVDGIPVMNCSYGNLNGSRALQVEEVLEHNAYDRFRETKTV